MTGARARFGSDILHGTPCVESDDRPGLFGLDGGYYLLPYFRSEAIDLARDDGVAFPSLGRSADSDFLCSLFPTHKYTPTPFEPIPLEVLGPERRDPRAKRQPIPRHEGGAIPRPSTLRDRRQTREKQAMAS